MLPGQAQCLVHRAEASEKRNRPPLAFCPRRPSTPRYGQQRLAQAPLVVAVEGPERHAPLLGGRPFDKATLYVLLTNPIYVGKTTHKGAVYDGEHAPIIDQDIFDRVQSVLKHNGRTGGIEVRNKYGALLRGLLRCKACDQALVHTFVNKKSGQCYRYYRCVGSIKGSPGACPAGTLPALEIERLVVDEVRALARDKT